jgi:hypothetical protein
MTAQMSSGSPPFLVYPPSLSRARGRFALTLRGLPRPEPDTYPGLQVRLRAHYASASPLRLSPSTPAPSLATVPASPPYLPVQFRLPLRSPHIWGTSTQQRGLQRQDRPLTINPLGRFQHPSLKPFLAHHTREHRRTEMDHPTFLFRRDPLEHGANRQPVSFPRPSHPHLENLYTMVNRIRQAIQPSLRPLLRFEIQGVALAA